MSLRNKNKTAWEAEVRWKLRENSKLHCFLIQFISFRGEASLSSSSPRSDYVWPPLAQPASLHPPSAVSVWSVSCINQHISLGLISFQLQTTPCFQSLQPSNEELQRKTTFSLSLKLEKSCSPSSQNSNYVDYTGKDFPYITNNKQMGQIWGEMLWKCSRIGSTRIWTSPSALFPMKPWLMHLWQKGSLCCTAPVLPLWLILLFFSHFV